MNATPPPIAVLISRVHELAADLDTRGQATATVFVKASPKAFTAEHGFRRHRCRVYLRGHRVRFTRRNNCTPNSVWAQLEAFPMETPPEVAHE